MKVSELICSDERWSKDAMAKTQEGRPTTFYSEEAHAYSLVGAIRKCYKGKGDGDILDKIMAKTGCERIPDWEESTTFETIKEIIEELDL